MKKSMRCTDHYGEITFLNTMILGTPCSKKNSPPFSTSGIASRIINQGTDSGVFVSTSIRRQLRRLAIGLEKQSRTLRQAIDLGKPRWSPMSITAGGGGSQKTSLRGQG